MNADENRMLIGVYLRSSAAIKIFHSYPEIATPVRRAQLQSEPRPGYPLGRERSSSRRPGFAATLARGLQQAHPAGGPTGLQPLVGLLLFLRGHDSLTCVAAFPDSRTRHEFGSTTAALLGHGLL